MGPQKRSLEVARWISLSFHPFIVSPAGIVLLLRLEGFGLAESLKWASLCAGLVVAPALLYLRKKLRERAFTDADVSVREHRFAFYAFGGACTLLCLLALFLLKAPQVLMAGAATALCALAVAIIVNRFWIKLSIHAGCVAGLAVACAYRSPAWAAFFGVGTAAVCWARWVSRRHTALQLVVGCVVAALCVVGVFGQFSAQIPR